MSDLEPEPPVSLRERAARGVLINSAFLIGLGGLNLLRAVIVAAYITASEFAVWSIVFFMLAFVLAVKSVIVSDKFVQQEENDQRAAFEKAFSLEAVAAACLFVVMIVSAPLFALAYGDSQLLEPGLALALVAPALAFQAPLWVYYRRLDFFRQRVLMSIDPVVAFVVTLPLAIAGMGYWSLVIGTVAGAWVGAVAVAVTSPYRFRWRFDRATLGEYTRFSTPLIVATVAAAIMGQLSLFLADAVLGLAAAGAVALAATFSTYTNRVDQVVTQTIYPVVCRVRDRREVLFEAFVKSNRLALMWGMPFGVGLAIFADDLVSFGIGEEWREAVPLLVAFGLASAISHIGFNWTAFYRAMGDTKPIAIVTVIALVGLLAPAVPLLNEMGVDGFGVAIGISTLMALVARWRYVRMIFPGFPIASHIARAVVPTIPASIAVLGARELIDGRSLSRALAELGAYILITAIVTLIAERRLISEIASYLNRPSRSRADRLVPGGAA